MAPIIFIAACLATKALDKNKKNAPNNLLSFTNLCEAPGSKALVLAALGGRIGFSALLKIGAVVPRHFAMIDPLGE